MTDKQPQQGGTLVPYSAELPRPFVPGDEYNPRDYFVVEQIHAILAAAHEHYAAQVASMAQPQGDAEQAAFEAWCPYRGSPDPRIVWAAAWAACQSDAQAAIAARDAEIERLRGAFDDFLCRMSEAPGTQVSASWKDAIRGVIVSIRTGRHPTPEAAQPADEWERLAWHLCAEEHGEDACRDLIWEGGPVPEPWGDRWMKYEHDAKRMIALVRQHASQPNTEAPADTEAQVQEVMRLVHSYVGSITTLGCPDDEQMADHAAVESAIRRLVGGK